jgi:hypothetical protein
LAGFFLATRRQPPQVALCLCQLNLGFGFGFGFIFLRGAFGEHVRPLLISEESDLVEDFR